MKACAAAERLARIDKAGFVADVSYGQVSQRLLRFQGLSNLRDDAGKDQLVARIDFPKPAAASDEARWQAAAATPLSACRTGR